METHPLAPMTHDDQPPNWTTVERFFHPTEAHIAAGKLESEGVPVYLLGVNHASVNWIQSIALGGIRLQVPADYLEAAHRILSERVEIEPDTEVCPSCGSADISPMNNSMKIALVSIHLLSVPLPWASNRRHCASCGYEWDSRA